MNKTEKMNENLNWYDQAKQHIQSWSDKFNININKIIEIAAYFAAGFFIGFLLKRFGRVAFFSIVILFIALLLLDHFHVIQIDWIKIRDFTGISPEETVGSLFQSCFQWIKSNMGIVIGSLIGLILGYKVG